MITDSINNMTSAPAVLAAYNCDVSIIKSLQSTGCGTVATTSDKSSNEPEKKSGSVNTDIAVAKGW